MLQSPEWSDEYLVGVEEVDLQHKYFVFLINKIKRYIENGIENITPYDIFSEIDNYARFHFKSEENLMLEYNYPKLGEQKAEHKKLCDHLVVKFNEVEDAEDNLEQLYEYLLEWFYDHTTKDDREMGLFVSNKLKK